jgi:hypothetical protein
MISSLSTWIRGKSDRFGVALSALCLLHCVSGVVLVGLLGLGGGAFFAPQVHQIGLMLAVAIGAVGLGFGVARHGRRGPLMIAAAGLALMAAGIMVPHGMLEVLVTVPGVALLAFAHIRNLRHCA